MSEDRLEKLFQLEKEFSQQGTAHKQGTGLGFVLVKELVDVNEEKIEVQ